ncbi:MAG: YkgJ family cysteine cluster protein [Nitrososphaeria archaeon]
MKQDRSGCVFLSNGRCTIYDHRPLVCMFYPFTLVERDRYMFQVDLACPRVGIREAVTEKAFIKLLREARISLNFDGEKSSTIESKVLK